MTRLDMGSLLAAAGSLAAAHLLLVSTARAEVASGLRATDAASQGKTDVASEGFAAPAVPAPEDKDATEASISAGGLAAAGNSRSLAVTAAVGMRVRRAAEQLSIATAANYSRAAPEAGTAMAPTVENLQGKVRYDHFLGGGVAVFGAVSARRDRFQGLDVRLNLDPGFAYYFVDRDIAQLWTELGYDFQYDVRRDETLAAAEGVALDKTQERHSGRLFLGQRATLNALVEVSSGAEYLQGIPDTEYWRLNVDGAVTAALASGFSVATSVTVKYDHHPLPGILDTDVQTAVSLVYRLH